MTNLTPLSLTNGILPLSGLVLLCVTLPWLLAGQTLSQGRLAWAIAATGVVVWAVGAGIMAWLYGQVNEGTQGIWHYFERSALLALLWGPVLALVWLMRAQGVERRRGLLMGRGA